jgi:uncharacterized coiled-coil DUF342 family protein
MDAGKKYEQIKQELAAPQSQTPVEPPIALAPPAELEEMKAVIAHLEAGLLQTSEELGAGKAALARAGERIDVMRKDLTQTVDDVVGVSRKLAKVDERSETVRADVEGVHTDIDGLRGDVKKAADLAEASTQKVAELAERVAQLQDGADGNGDVAGLQAAIKELEAELNGCNQSLKQAQKAIDGRQELQVGTTRFQGCKSKRRCPCSYGLCPRLRSRHCRVARGSGAVSGGFASPQDHPRAVLVIHGAIVFLFMVFTISVVEGFAKSGKGCA